MVRAGQAVEGTGFLVAVGYLGDEVERGCVMREGTGGLAHVGRYLTEPIERGHLTDGIAYRPEQLQRLTVVVSGQLKEPLMAEQGAHVV